MTIGMDDDPPFLLCGTDSFVVFIDCEQKRGVRTPWLSKIFVTIKKADLFVALQNIRADIAIMTVSYSLSCRRYKCVFGNSQCQDVQDKGNTLEQKHRALASQGTVCMSFNQTNKYNPELTILGYCDHYCRFHIGTQHKPSVI
jgi:hypothetical protein